MIISFNLQQEGLPSGDTPSVGDRQSRMNSQRQRAVNSSGEATNDSDVWLDIEEKNSEKPKQATTPDLWQLAEDRLNLAKYKPVKIADAEVAEVSSTAEIKRYTLRNPHNDKYIIIGDRELFLWNIIDGQNTVKDIVLEYVSRYDLLGPQLLIDLLSMLRDNGFLEEKPVSVYQSLIAPFRKSKFLAPFMSALIFFLHGTLTTRKTDSYFDWLYTHIAHLFYTRPFFIIAVSLFVADIAFFVFFFLVQHTGLLISLSHSGDHVYDDFALIILNIFLAVLVHEHTHALTVKAYGRKVLRGGLMLYFGLPLVYVDTTDIWMKPRRARMAVSFAGPFSNALLGGVLFSVAAFLPDTILRSIFLQAGILNTTLFFLNVLPIAETDGHYIIQDYLEMPRLRTKVLNFIRLGMWQKLARHERWAKNDFIFLIYGLIFVAGAGFTLYLGMHFWLTTIEHLVKAAFSRPMLLVEVLSVLVAIMIVFNAICLGMLWSKRASRIENLLQSRLEGG